MSLRIGGSCISSSVGIFELIVRTTQPTSPCCTKALTRKRPMPTGAIAKLHSFVASNSRVCLSFMMERTSTALCSGVNARSDCGRISPSTLIAGGKPAVMNRSDPLRSTSRLRRSCMSLIACSRSMSRSRPNSRCEAVRCPLHLMTYLIPYSLAPAVYNLPSAHGSERIFVLRFEACLFFGDDPLLQQLGQTLIERLHPVLLTGLNRRVHLGDLALANQVTNRRSADHDLVRCNTAASDSFQKGLRDHRAQRFGQHRTHHFFLGGGEDIDDTIDRLRRRARMQRSKYQVPGFRRRERQPNRLEIAHLTDEHDVRIFTQRRAQRLAETERIAVY